MRNIFWRQIVTFLPATHFSGQITVFSRANLIPLSFATSYMSPSNHALIKQTQLKWRNSWACSVMLFFFHACVSGLMSWRPRGPVFISFHADGRAKISQDDKITVAVCSENMWKKKLLSWAIQEKRLAHVNILITRNGRNSTFKKKDPTEMDFGSVNLFH